MTALSAAVSTVLMGLIGNVPFAIAAGLGINAVVAYQAAPHMTGFIALIGLVDAGFVTRGSGTVVTLGTEGRLTGWPIVVFVATLLLMFVLWVRRVPGAILLSIIAGTVLAVLLDNTATIEPRAWGVVVPTIPDSFFATPDFTLFGDVDVFGGFARAGFVTALVVLFTIAGLPTVVAVRDSKSPGGAILGFSRGAFSKLTRELRHQ